MRATRTYSALERAEAVALAAVVGPVRAAEQLGLPRRTVTNWTHHGTSSPIIAAAERTIAERLEEAHSEALAAVMAGLRDPKAKLGDRATALRVLGDQVQLARGRANLNVDVHAAGDTFREQLTDEQERELRTWLDSIESASDEELASAAAIQRVALLDDPDRRSRVKERAKELEEATE